MSYYKNEYKYQSTTDDNILFQEEDRYQREQKNGFLTRFLAYFQLNEFSPVIQKAITFILKTIGSSALGAFLALALTCIVIVGLLAFASNPITAALLPLLPVIFITVAWAAAGISAGIGAFITAIQHIKMHHETNSTMGWLGLGVGLMGTFATTGAVVGTFIPVPVLGTLVGAASGAVMGVLAGAAAWAVSGIVAGIVSAYKNRQNSPYEIVGDDYPKHYEDNSEYTVITNKDNRFGNNVSSGIGSFFSPKNEVVEENSYTPESRRNNGLS